MFFCTYLEFDGHYILVMKKTNRKKRESYDDLVSDISRDGQEYLDLTLDQEAELLKKYQSMLENQ